MPSAPGKNLAINGDFEKPEPTGVLPDGWTTKHPKNVKLIDAGGRHKHVIEMTGDEDLMGTYGVDLTGGKIAFKPNTRYRCTGWTKSAGPAMKVFVKGYATLTHTEKGKPVTAEEPVYQMRKDIEPTRDWKRFNLDFDVQPTHEFSNLQHKVEYLRITLWAFWPAGTCWFDDIRFEEVGPIPDSQRRHPDAVTNAGAKPRLSTNSRPAESAPDEEQLWMDAANAFRAENYDEAMRLAAKLIERNPASGEYRLLAARTAAKLKKWPEADAHARWLLENPKPTATRPARKIEDYQREWARVVHAEVLLNTGHRDEGRRMLETVAKEAKSPHARTAAEGLLQVNE